MVMQMRRMRKLTYVHLLTFLILLSIGMRAGFALYNPPFSDSWEQSAHAYIPAMNLTVGLPPHFSESPLLSYSLMLPYLSVIQSGIVMKILITIMSSLLIFMLVRDITKSNKSALFGVLLFAVLPNAALTQGLFIYDGAFFTSFFTILSIYFLLDYESERKNASLFYSLLSLALAILVWNGGIIAIPTYAFVIGMLYFFRKVRHTRLAIGLGIAVIIAFYIYLYLPLPHPPIVNLNTSIIHKNIPLILSLNLLFLVTQGTSLLYPLSIFFIFGLINFGLLYWLPIMYAISKREFLEHKAFFAMLAALFVAIPIALMDCRYESLVFMPLVVLAGTASKYTLPVLARQRALFVVLFIFMGCLCAMEIWLIPGLE